jgi:hypothetical protein
MGAPVAGYVRHLDLQSDQPRAFQTRENLTSVGEQEHEVYGSPSHLSSTSPGPVEVCRHQAAMPMRCGMDDRSASTPEGVQQRGGMGRWRIHIHAEWPEGVRAVHEDVTQADRLGESQETEAALGAQSISQLGDRHVAQALRSLAHCVVGSQPTSKEVARHGQIRCLSALYKVGEHVTDPPALTPGRRVPCRLVQRLHLVGELATQTSCLLPYIHDPRL